MAWSAHLFRALKVQVCWTFLTDLLNFAGLADFVTYLDFIFAFNFFVYTFESQSRLEFQLIWMCFIVIFLVHVLDLDGYSLILRHVHNALLDFALIETVVVFKFVGGPVWLIFDIRGVVLVSQDRAANLIVAQTRSGMQYRRSALRQAAFDFDGLVLFQERSRDFGTLAAHILTCAYRVF